jgi:long-chain acyl-CoA synthetase
VPTSAEVRAQLTGPGGPFEVVTETVLGRPMKVYKQRLRSLREVPALAQGRGDGQPHIVFGDRRIGFTEFVGTANGISRGLTDLCGIRRGDRVAVLSANNPEWCLTFWGTVDLGAVLVGLNGWWKADEIVFGLQDSGARVLVADAARLARVAGRLSDCPDLEVVYVVDPLEEPGDGRLRPFAELLGDAGPELPSGPIDEDDPAVIFYTSGTTGRPKGAVSTHRSMIANLQNTFYNAMAGALANPSAGGPAVGGGGQAVSLMTSPLFHVSGCHSGIVVGLAGGARVVMPTGRFDPEEAMRLIEHERVTVWGAVPTMVWRVVEHPARHSYDLSSVATVAYGGSPSAGELQRRVKETFPNVTTLGNAYGLTESSSVATVNYGQEFLDRPESVGRPMPVVEIRVVDEAGGEVPPGELGEVCISGPILMPGYWNRPDATCDVLRDGWLFTGDIGYLDKEGYLYITDRAKDMIIRGGENVYCVEIENRLVEHPGIAEAAVVGVPHPTLGEEVKAVVRTEPGATVTAEDVRAWVKEALADFKVPTHVELVTEPLPRNPSGKLLKNVLRGQGEVSFAETL